MSRVTPVRASAPAFAVRNANNVYTALAGAAALTTLLGLIALFVRAGTLFDGGLFGG